MTTQTEILSLSSLDYLPFLDENGIISEEIQGKIGVYAIFDQEKVLQFVGYSRDIYLSLKQHLVRQPNHCYWIKLQTISRPSRTILEEIRQAWLSENGSIQMDEAKWTQPIDAKLVMSETEKQDYQKLDEMGQIKLLKKVSRRVEETILQQLKERGVQLEIRFSPKLKEEGLLDLKP
ncbi:Nuclease subunit of the excinuclease complex [Aphanothece hegewaldii CCALA 016]|uniref:Nuclease subunit of the excinuclease complex n=1 Tax=Aphanothece hegewaldii CCALA 016 TaxID=2107694 RepID=A0A2T1M2T7_9CHRO|nr:GIY-YIG nuclease family protein [Aphanothece hegewaldii]PSF39052.1 Nuclease subunit of the excinuclease complex [Aphanothece hegewaldii CCALA 016]